MKTSEKTLALCHAIEAAGASEALTKCSVLASELHTEIREMEAGLISTEVIQAIEGERAHQERKWPGHAHTTAEWLLIIEKLCADARRAWVTGHGDNEALHEIRQITATGVACLEQCGAPKRGEPVTGRRYAG